MALIFGGLLAALGVVTYAMSDTKSGTALIPTAFGALLALMGFLARKPSMRMHAMHGAALIALLGLIGSGMMAIRAIASGTIARPAATASQAVMALLCLVFLVLCVRTFIAARRARQAGTL